MAKLVKKPTKKPTVSSGKSTMSSDKLTQDSFTNFMHKLGMGTDGPLTSATYSLTTLISRNRVLLEAGYRSSWLIGQAVDAVAEDMTKMGIDMMSKLSPDAIKKLQVGFGDYNIWEALCNTIKWARLYGGALGVILIDGAKYDQPLDLDKIGKNTFKGILVLDRWMCEPLLECLITDFNKDFGKPEFYRIHTSVPATNVKLPLLKKIHHSRIMRFDGITLPFYQKVYENYWGLSVVERIYDRLLSYDSATLGASQLMYKSFLRTIGIKGLREAFIMGGKTENAIIKQFEYIRKMQSNEGITLIDAEDQFDIKQNSFGGVAELLIQFGQQISGATGIPLVRLFGQSPSGFSTGDTDLRNYYDNINREQENKLRPHLSKLLEVMSLSILGQKLPEDFEYKFVSLWQMSDKEKSEIATADMATIQGAFGAGLITKEMALKELQQASRVTGKFSNITDEDLQKAKEEDENQPPPGVPGEAPSGVTAENPLGAGEGTAEPGVGEQPIEEQDEIPEEIKPETPAINFPIKIPIKPLNEFAKPVMQSMSLKFKQAMQNIRERFFSNMKNNSSIPVVKTGDKKTTDWIGVDLDGTLAEYHGWNDGQIGRPIQKMVDHVKGLIDGGKTVKVFTARIKDEPESAVQIKEWLKSCGLPELEVVNEKDQEMEYLIDDRAKEVEKNTGEFKNKTVEPLLEMLEVLREIKTGIQSREQKPKTKPASATSGIVYKGYTIKQILNGTFEIYASGGTMIDNNIASLELAMNRVNEISLEG